MGKMKTNKLKPTHLYINYKEKFRSTMYCIFLNKQTQCNECVYRDDY